MQGQGQGKETGVCKWFNVQKGFGFITPSQGGDDLFVHQTAIHAQGFRSLEEGEKVEFDREMNPEKGKPKAVNVTGPQGDYVKGAPRQQNDGYNSNFNSGRGRGQNRGDDRGYQNQGSNNYSQGQGRQSWGQGQQGQNSYGQGQQSYGQQQSYGNNY